MCKTILSKDNKIGQYDQGGSKNSQEVNDGDQDGRHPKDGHRHPPEDGHHHA